MLKKAIFTVFLFACFFSGTRCADAATKYWIGSSGGLFSDSNNWSLSSGGTATTTPPGASDIATFDGGGTNNATISTTTSVLGINITSGYSGTITQSAGVSVTVGTSNFVIAGGAFTASAGAFIDSGTFTLSGGTFTASAATTTFQSSFTKNGGTFNANGGNTEFDAVFGSVSYVLNGGAAFNNVLFTQICTGCSGGTGIFVIDDNMSVQGNLNIYNITGAGDASLVESRSSENPTITVGGNLNFLNANGSTRTLGSLTAANNLTVDLAGNFSMVNSNAFLYASVVFNGTGNQTISKTNGVASTTMSSTKGSGTLTIPTYTNASVSDSIVWNGGSVTDTGGNGYYLLTVNAGTFTSGTSTYYLGPFTLSGGTFAASAATTTFYANFTATSSGTYNADGGVTEFNQPTVGSCAISPAGVSFNNVVFDGGGSGAPCYIDSNMNIGGNLNVYGTSGTYSAVFASRNSENPILTVAGNLTLPTGNGSTLGSATVANNLTVDLAGNFAESYTNAHFYASVVFNGTGNQTISKTNGVASTTMSSTKGSGTLTIPTYTNASVSDSIVWNGGSVTDTGGNGYYLLTVNAGTFTSGTSTYYLGPFTLSGGTFAASAATTTFYANFTATSSGTYNADGGVTEFNQPTVGSCAISPAGVSFNNVVFDGGGSGAPCYIDSNMNIGGNLNVYGTSGTYSAVFASRNSENPILTVAGNLTLPTGNGSTLGSATVANNLTVDLAGNFAESYTNAHFYASVVFNGTGNQTISKTNGVASTTMSSTKGSGTLTIPTYTNASVSDSIVWNGGSVTDTGGNGYYLLTVNAGTFTSGTSTYYLGPFTLSGGTFAASAATTTFYANFTATSSGTYNADGGVTGFDLVAGTSPAISSGGVSFNNVAFLGGTNGGGVCSYQYYVDSNMTITGSLFVYNLTGNPACFDSRSSENPTITVGGNLSFPSTAAATINLGSATAANNLTVDLAGNLSMFGTNAFLYAPIVFNGTGNQTISKTAGTIGSQSTWTVNKTSGSAILASTIAHPSSITVTAGTLDAAGNTLTAASGLFINNGGTLKLQGGETITAPTLGVGSTTVIYYGSGAYPSLIAGNNYDNLVFNGSGNWTLGSNLNATGTLSIISGTLLGNAKTVNLIGNWVNDGTFTHGNGTVNFTGSNQSISGSSGTTFYNFSKATTTADTLTFPSNVTTTIANNTTLEGTTSNLLSLRSDTPGSQSSVNIGNSGTRTIQYVDVKDNDNTNAAAVLCTINCTNSFNDINWIFHMSMTTNAANPIGTSTATLNANIVDNGGSNATQYGFAYGTSTDLSGSDTATTTLGAFSGNGAFSEGITGLSCNATYYFRAYTVNAAGTSTGAILSFATPICTESIITNTVSPVGTSTATLNATISYNGGSDATQHGFAYGTSTDLSGADTATSTLGAFSGTGSFTENLSALSCGISYYVRAYSVNAAGTSTGAVQTFTTSVCIPTVSTTASANITGSGADVGGSVDVTGGENGLEHGFVYGTSTDLSGSDTATTTLGAYTGTGSFSETLSGLTCAIPYYFMAYAVNSVGTSTGDILSFTTNACPVASPPSGGSTGGSFGFGGNSGPSGGGGATIGFGSTTTPPTSFFSSSTTAPTSTSTITPPASPGFSSSSTPPTNLPPDTLRAIPEGKAVLHPQPPTVIQTIVTGIVSIVGTAGGAGQDVSEAVENTLNTPVGKVVDKTFVTAGALTGIFLGSLGEDAETFSFSDILLAISRSWGLLLIAFGLRKRAPPWGFVYDSVTSRPLDPAVVIVYDQNGQEVATAITDLDGRYGFLLPAGTYTIVAGKTHYAFPSKRLAGKRSDGLHTDLYFGEQFTVAESGAVVKRTIPMDPVAFDWNEFIKKEERLTTFYSRYDPLVQHIGNILLSLGLVLSLLSLVYFFNIENLLIFAVYSMAMLFVLFGRGIRAYGTIRNGVTGRFMPFSRITVYSKDKETVMSQKIADRFGHYFCLVPKGHYYVTIEKRNGDGSFSPAFTSDLINAQKGIIRKSFKV